MDKTENGYFYIERNVAQERDQDIKWVESKHQLADCLTKPGSSRSVLLTVLNNSSTCLNLFLSCCSLLVQLFQGVNNIDWAELETGIKGAMSP